MVLLFSLNVNADCDWKTGITPGPDKTFVYTEECHQKVGALVKSNSDLTQALQLKDLALQASDSRTQLWTKNAEDAQDRLLKMDSDSKESDLIMFGLGALTVLGAGYVTAKLVGK